MTVRNSFSSVGGWAASLNAPTLPWALGEPALQSTPGFPRTVAQRASASKLFAVLNNVKGIGRDDLGALLERMFRNPLKDGWFNARTEDARSIRDEFSRLLGGALVLDVRSVKWRGQERVEKCSGTVPSANGSAGKTRASTCAWQTRMRVSVRRGNGRHGPLPVD